MDVFVYGTLTDPDRANTVLSEFGFSGTATLSGLSRVDGAYPTLAPGGSVDGRILSTPDVELLDEYEGVASGLYTRVSVPSRGRDGTVDVYVGDPAKLDAPASWPGEGSFPERVRTYLETESVWVETHGG
jgi:gamma-glutamylcyclotransferase (GGCT)/AIG2-like uncharacterized protein YtfP